MPQFFIRAVNTNFQSRDDGGHYDRAEAALAAGVQSGVSIAADEILCGQPNSAVEVCIELADGTPVLRSVIAMSVSPLMVVDSGIGDE